MKEKEYERGKENEGEGGLSNILIKLSLYIMVDKSPDGA